MTKKKLIDLNIRTFDHADMEEVIHVWEKCGLIRDWNNPKLDIQRKANTQKDLFFVGILLNKIISTTMFGYDGYRGWLNYFAVLHHMDEPMTGWRVLVDLLKPSGLMMIGLYSELARQHIVEVRKEIRALRVGTSEADIRKFRQSLAESYDENHQLLTT